MRTLKYDPDLWADFKKDTQFDCNERSIRIVLSEPGSIYCKTDAGWQLVAHGTEFNIEFPYPGFVCKASVSGALFVPPTEPIEDSNEVLTNMDKRPGMSGAEQMIMRMRREQMLKEQSAALKRERANLKAAKDRIAKGLTDKLPQGVVEPPEPEPEATPEPELKPEPATPTAE